KYLEFACISETAAKLARSRGVAHQLETAHPQRILGLKDFYGCARCEVVHRHHNSGSIVSIGTAQRAVQQFIEHRRLAASRLAVADGNRAGSETGRRDGTLRIHLDEGGKHGVIDDMRRREVVIVGRWMLRIDDARGWKDEINIGVETRID